MARTTKVPVEMSAKGAADRAAVGMLVVGAALMALSAPWLLSPALHGQEGGGEPTVNEEAEEKPCPGDTGCSNNCYGATPPCPPGVPGNRTCLEDSPTNRVCRNCLCLPEENPQKGVYCTCLDKSKKKK